MYKLLVNSGYYLEPLTAEEMCKMRLYEAILTLRNGDECLIVWPDITVYGRGNGWSRVKPEGEYDTCI